MVAEAIILTALKEPVKKLLNLISDGVSKGVSEKKSKVHYKIYQRRYPM